MKKTKIIKIKSIHPHFLLDTDGDNHLDYEDCHPFDKTKHTLPLNTTQSQDYYYLQKQKEKNK